MIGSLSYIASCFFWRGGGWYCEAIAWKMESDLFIFFASIWRPRFYSDAILIAVIASTDCPLQNAKQAPWFWQCLEIDFCSSLLNREVHLYTSVKQAICALHPKSFRSFRPLQFFTPPSPTSHEGERGGGVKWQSKPKLLRALNSPADSVSLQPPTLVALWAYVMVKAVEWPYVRRCVQTAGDYAVAIINVWTSLSSSSFR